MRHPVFVVGSPRSGTSALVDSLLSAGYHGFREGSFLSLITTIDQLIDRHYSVFATDKRVLVSAIEADALKERIHGVFEQLVSAQHQAGPWFDKIGNPEMIMAIPVIRTLWPESVYIFAKRRPIENITSRLKKFPAHSFEYHCADWAKNMLAWRKVRQQLPAGSYTEVKQLDMIRSPEAVADSLGALLELTSAQKQSMAEAFRSKRPQETAQGTAARLLSLAATGWSARQIEAFRNICQAEIDAYGYSLDESYSVGRAGSTENGRPGSSKGIGTDGQPPG